MVRLRVKAWRCNPDHVLLTNPVLKHGLIVSRHLIDATAICGCLIAKVASAGNTGHTETDPTNCHRSGRGTTKNRLAGGQLGRTDSTAKQSGGTRHQ